MKGLKKLLWNVLNSQTRLPLPSYGGWLYGWKPIKLIYPHEPETVKFFQKNLKPGMTVIDAGANVGFFTLLFSDLVGKNGKVIAYEPDSLSFKRLVRSTRRKKNVQVFHAGVGSPGTMTLYGKRGSGRNSLNPIGEPVETVDVVAMPPADLAKIDVEGFELQVLRNMPKMPCTVEYAPKLSEPGYLESIRDLGYTIYSIGPDGEATVLDESTLPTSGHCNLYLVPNQAEQK